jgi:hypothetical protein
MPDTTDPPPATLDDVVAALGALAVALTPALTPATRPTWDQLRWSPSPVALGELDDELVVDPRAAVDSGGWPTAVAPDQLIESAWGNAVVTGLGKVAVGAGSARIGPHSQAGIGQVLGVPVAPIVAYATRMVVRAALWIGSDSTALAGVTGSVLPALGGATSQPVTPPVSATAGGGQYALQSLEWSWVVPASADPSFAIHGQWTSGGGTIYTATDCTWTRYRS